MLRGSPLVQCKATLVIGLIPAMGVIISSSQKRETEAQSLKDPVELYEVVILIYSKVVVYWLFPMIQLHHLP